MTRNRLALLALVSALSMMAASCGGDGDDDGGGEEGGGGATSSGGGGNLTAEQLPAVSVQQSDLPSGYAPKPGFPKRLNSVAECVNALAPGMQAAISQLQSLGLESCDSSVFTK